ncbi:hypothetical protein [Endozoicomonas sp.]|uniref:hypothetical protein n=1 Tax=Endozoicomonas sp. TaxID=1892382 RepID=UPI00383A93DF
MTFPFNIPDNPKDDLVRKLLEYTTNLEKKITLVLEDNTCLLEDNTCLLEDNTRPPCVSIVVTSPEIRNLNRGRSVSDQWPAIQKSSKSPSFRR